MQKEISKFAETVSINTNKKAGKYCGWLKTSEKRFCRVEKIGTPKQGETYLEPTGKKGIFYLWTCLVDCKSKVRPIVIFKILSKGANPTYPDGISKWDRWNQECTR